jgi:hypothetical protein
VGIRSGWGARPEGTLRTAPESAYFRPVPVLPCPALSALHCVHFLCFFSHISSSLFLKEPEYSDDEDFEGDEDPEESGSHRGGGGSNGIGYGGKAMPPIDSYHKAKNGGGGLPQIR